MLHWVSWLPEPLTCPGVMLESVSGNVILNWSPSMSKAEQVLKLFTTIQLCGQRNIEDAVGGKSSSFLSFWQIGNSTCPQVLSVVLFDFLWSYCLDTVDHTCLLNRLSSLILSCGLHFNFFHNGGFNLSMVRGCWDDVGEGIFSFPALWLSTGGDPSCSVNVYGCQGTVALLSVAALSSYRVTLEVYITGTQIIMFPTFV